MPCLGTARKPSSSVATLTIRAVPAALGSAVLMRLYNRTAPQEHTVGQLGSNETAPAEPAEGSGKSP